MEQQMQPKDRMERFWLIELISYWEGKVNATLLASCFGTGRQAASETLVAYRSVYPDNLYFSASVRGYLPSEGFECHRINGDVSEYLDWIGGQAKPVAPAVSVSHQCLTLPPRNVSPLLMRTLIQAIREQRRMEVDYVSLSNPDHEGRIIVPHTFVRTGLRWHLRAWCEKSQSYRDFVLSRFRGSAELLDLSPQSAGQDEAWQTEITLIIQPDPRLAATKQQVLIHDYAMQNGKLYLKTRAALAQYLLQELHINHKMLDGNPDAQQLILANMDEVRQWLF